MEIIGALADQILQILVGRLLAAVEIGFHGAIIFLDGHFHQGGTQLGGLVGIFGRNVDLVELGAQLLVMPDQRLHLDDIDDALEIGFGANRPGDDHRTGAQTIDHHVDTALEVGARAIHLVDEADARHVIFVGLAPDGFRLRLDTGNGVKHRDRTVQHAHRTLDFNGEVDVTGRVDDVDPVFFPVAGGRGRRDGDAAFLFLLHEVHGGGAVMDFADLVGLAGVIKDALGRRGLAGIDMRGNPDIPVHVEGSGTCHGGVSGLPAIVREGAVGVGHLVGVFALLDGRTAIVGGIHQFAGKTALHGGLVAAAGGSDQPANGERAAAVGAHFDGHLIGGAADAAGAHFERRGNVAQGFVKDDQRILLGLGGDGIEGDVDDAFGGGLLAVIHQGVHELGEHEVAKLGIRGDFAAFGAVAAGHLYLLTSDAWRHRANGASCGP